MLPRLPTPVSQHSAVAVPVACPPRTGTAIDQAAGYAFDVDDNILTLPTRIIIFRKSAAEGSQEPEDRIEVTTAEFARVRLLVGRPTEALSAGERAILGEVVGKAGATLSDYEMRYDDPQTGSMQNFRTATSGNNRFLADLQVAVAAGKFQGPVWSAFAKAMSRPQTAAQTTVITMRGHAPAELLAGFCYLQRLGLIANVPQLENIYPVSNSEVAARLLAPGGKAVAASELKTRVMAMQLDAIEAQAQVLKSAGQHLAQVWNREGTAYETLLTWGFSDDDWGNFSAAHDFLVANAERWPSVKCTLFYTGDHPDHPRSTEVIVGSGRSRPVETNDLEDASRLCAAMLKRRSESPTLTGPLR